MPSSQFRYPWPASRLTRQEMATLYIARERSPNNTPITDLVAAAVRQVYGHTQADSPQQKNHNPRKEDQNESES